MNYDNLDLAILKTIISNKKHALDFVNECDTKIFSSDIWNFANLIFSHIKIHKDVPTLRILTENLAKGKNEKLIEHINKMWEEVCNFQYDEKEYRHDLNKLKERYANKEINKLFDKIEQNKDNVNTCVSEIQKTISLVRSLNAVKTYESKNIKDYLPTFVNNFNAKKNDPSVNEGLKTKYSFFDYATNGIKPADFVLIAGESGFGKSLFLKNMAIQTWLQDNTINIDNFSLGKNIIYFSLEMPYEDCFNRLISRLSGVPSRKLENANLTKEEFTQVKFCLDFIKKYPYNFKIVDIVDACANDLEVIMLELGENFDAIFIDYLGIMKPNEKIEEQDWLKQGIVAYETRAIGRKYRLPIFSAVQLNRKSANKDPSESIGLSRLARSGTIATHATHVIQIENRPNEENYPDFIYHFIKNRKGPKGKGVLVKNLACATLLDTEKKDIALNDYFINQIDISEQMEDLEI
jgi:replicative DNA helicase